MTEWATQVVQFWFDGTDEAQLATSRSAWFRKDAAFDDAIRQRFLPLWQRAAAGELLPDPADAHAVLAWLIVADQFSRNLFRGEAQAFALDAQARTVAKAALAVGLEQQLPPVARWFFYLPLEHSEALADQDESVRRFESLSPDSPERASVVDYAEKHRAIIVRFGRFPHRNAALGRPSTADELLFLAQPGSSF
ncbi:DUF924 family protein [Vogesella indigofera]|uniref:DUF924 domain-containing protein n=1 Tax=Vogesella indigofera TaxID=45465 RepID=A0ABT5I7J3_VOGIN|nr:DUF924 family protein [Vogesella indigofera]MDC7692145.1 DUF924 domain-containing protein [Vogesella indigofera]